MHQIDMTLNRPAIAFRGEVPWHGLGETIQPGDDLSTIQHKAGIDYIVERSHIQFERKGVVSESGHVHSVTGHYPERHVLYRSDTGAPLSVVGQGYQIVQPDTIVDFYRNLVGQYGFEIEVVGALFDGRKIWALANTDNAVNLPGADKVKGYMLLATSYDGTMATQARFTSIRVVCNNTLGIANSEGKAAVTVPHSTSFDIAKVQKQLSVGEYWDDFARNAERMAQREVTHAETAGFLVRAYYDLKDADEVKAFMDEEKNAKPLEKFLARMETALISSPGSHMESARNMLWGALQAVTYDVDHAMPSRTQNSRLDKAWFGKGDAIKQRAYQQAAAMV